jgi:hypothetical protein
MHSPSPRARPRLPPFLIATLLGCGGAIGCGGQEPAGPAPPPGPPAVAQVVIASPIGTLLAVARGVELQATARDRSGNGVPGATFVWATTDPAIATVAGGRVTGVAPGAVTITATSDGIRGSIDLVLVRADLDGTRALLTDPLVGALVTGALPATAAALRSALQAAADAATTGNVAAIRNGLAAVRGRLGSPANADESILLPLLLLFVDQAERLLNL